MLDGRAGIRRRTCLLWTCRLHRPRRDDALATSQPSIARPPKVPHALSVGGARTPPPHDARGVVGQRRFRGNYSNQLGASKSSNAASVGSRTRSAWGRHGRPRGGARAARPRWFRMRAAMNSFSIAAASTILSPHVGHKRESIPQLRRTRTAQASRRSRKGLSGQSRWRSRGAMAGATAGATGRGSDPSRRW